MKIEDIVKDYAGFVEQRKQSWREVYSPSTVEILIHETDILTSELEKSLDGKSPGRGHEILEQAFYHKKRELDEKGEFAEFPEEYQELMRFVARSSFTSSGAGGTVYNSTTQEEARRKIFNIWSLTQPDLIHEIIKKTKDQVKQKNKPNLVKYFESLEQRPIKDIPYSHLQYEPYLKELKCDESNPFQRYANDFVRKLIKGKFLITTPGFKKSKISVPQNFLR